MGRPNRNCYYHTKTLFKGKHEQMERVCEYTRMKLCKIKWNMFIYLLNNVPFIHESFYKINLLMNAFGMWTHKQEHKVALCMFQYHKTPKSPGVSNRW